MNDYYALIMAGGGGTRLWPLSRRGYPKHMLPLVTDSSMFHVSVTRLASIYPPERIFVVTGEAQVAALQADVPELPTENFIIEPFGRDSGPAAALGVAHVASIDPNAVIAILTADHHIRDVWGFGNALRAAYQVAKQGYIVTLGIKPTYPATGFGYIQRSQELMLAEGLQVYHSAGFKEKPSADVAQQFLDSGLYSWNSGMFIWSAQQALGEFARQQPAIYQPIQQIQAAFASDHYRKTIQEVWGEIPRISLDFAVMENAQHMAMIPIDIGWSDIGNWAAVYDEQATHPGANVTQGVGRYIDINTRGSLINSNRLVVTIGLDDIVIVDTDDVLLVCRRECAQDVKLAVKQLEDKGLDKYL